MSLHKASYTNEAFAASYARERQPFCQACHAPLADPFEEPPKWAAEHGIACTSCHVVAEERPGAKHPALTQATCASCHEFEFLRSRRRPPGSLMQSTATEHAASAFAETSCADCHMPRVGDGHRDHTFAISREPALLRQALSARARRDRQNTVVLELEPMGVGHAFPTGDLFRRLELQVTAHDTRGRVRYDGRRYLARHFEARPDPMSHEPDDRLRGPTEIPFEIPPGARRSDLRWRVTYQRVDHLDRRDPAASTVAGQIVLAEGRL